jgi:NADH-quinone oxidoreductase subunit E
MNDVPVVPDVPIGDAIANHPENVGASDSSAVPSGAIRPDVPAVPSGAIRLPPPSLKEEYPDEVQSILAKYPADQKRSAVMPLLYLAQRQGGYITKQAMQDIAAILEITPTEVAGIVGFYSLYYDEPAGKYRIQVCTDLPCALRGADQFLEKLCENLGIKLSPMDPSAMTGDGDQRTSATTSDGLVTVEAVMCLAGCDKAPMFQVQTGDGLEYHEHQTVESALVLIESWRNHAVGAGARPERSEGSSRPNPQPEES